ncbi:caspase family protein [Azospirillum agricola]|uniref:caspase family protein n=1 Tax=Azospirillum agricola TaxID=1720247 RepID=UPI000A0F0AD4|nr:caspase family protein [Azospirillum agricola]SMH31929.1 Caspase domain-containing protein [Azospirillum lipoferum]
MSSQPTTAAPPPPATAEASFPGPRHALVIGAKSYRNIKPLERTLEDAKALADALEKRGFLVTLVKEPDRRALALAAPAFAEELRRSPGALAFVLFAGHGVEIKGANYLLPIDFPDVRDLPPGQGEALVRSDALALDSLLAEVKAAQPRYLVALFDACRDNPLVAAGSRSVGGTRGLARIDAESNTAVMFTAGAGERALDRLPGNDPSPNGLFMRHFLTQMDNRDWPLDRIFRETAKRVVQDAGGKANHSQHPAHHSQIYDDIVLAAPPPR